MSSIDAGVRAPGNPLREEMRAMLQLSWPMILTNLGQTAMTATDVLMMGRLGPDALAAGSLGANLYFMPMIFGLGLMTAASPMIAIELGRKRHSVRDVRRTVRQGLWSVIAMHVTLVVGLSLMFTPLMTDALGHLPAALDSHGSAILATLQQVAGAAGTALFVTVMSLGAARPGGVADVAGAHAAFLCAALIATVALPLTLLMGGRKPAGKAVPAV